MKLVHQSKDDPGLWQINWMLMPHFLAIDGELRKHVDQRMMKAFHGTKIEHHTKERLELQLHHAVIELCLERYKMPGLREYLSEIINLVPEEELTSG